MPPLLSLKIPNDEPLPQPFLFRSTVTLMNSNLHLNSHSVSVFSFDSFSTHNELEKLSVFLVNLQD
ncbi:hypothetical protein F2Q69_00048061 [Brassica cretica]|uniref:Uncharacterized protein n=1 Tax=Brassica cretica TaxID=69181 RepID=A0A8S9Q7Q4_BRACR|nr:hypothetical protein F2Q69_00048061 [Brassica cretica]